MHQLLTQIAFSRAAILFAVFIASVASSNVTHAHNPPEEKKPNILLMVLDDVGIDQLKAFGYGGPTPPKTPNINTIAKQGVRFRNTWSMPECSPSRAVLFTGRFPFRTNIYQAIGPNDLANSQVSPFEMTVPRVLETRGYTSAMFGKFHLAGPENNPYGTGTPNSLGFDYFYGYIGGLPASIDTTAGGIAPTGTYACGFVNSATEGACRFPSGRCEEGLGGAFPGKQCLEQGGLFVPNATCDSSSAIPLNFNLQNAYYVSPIVVNRKPGLVRELPLTDPRGRRYRTIVEVDAARDWINGRSADSPWMASVTFSADHTPIQCPPDRLLSKQSRIANNLLDCSKTPQQRVLSDRMIEAMDTEIGRLLVETGMARRSTRGSLELTAKGADTMIVILGDNGSVAQTVQLPFDPTRAKATAYQTGVWVPLLVSGPFVKQKDRDVEHMTNLVDVFELFGEIAGAKVHELVPRPLDSRPLLPYLTNSDQKAIRKVNFTQGGMNIQANPFGNGPCLFGTSCSQTPISKGVCEDNGGVWWGAGATDPSTAGIPSSGLNNCCELNQFFYTDGQPTVSLLPNPSATRNETYKLVRNITLDYNPTTNSCVNSETFEFYEINQAKNNPKIDRAGAAIPLDSLTPKQAANYQELSAAASRIFASQVPCPGDGNIDGVVDQKDINGYNFFVKKTAENLDGDSNFTSSVFDFNFDGQTNSADLTIIQSNLGTKCTAQETH